MAWLIERWTGAAYTEWTGVGLDKIPEELNGHMEAVLKIPNTSANRTICVSDTKIRITYGVENVFIGLLYAPEYSQRIITGFVYNECIETMKEKTITKSYNAIAASTILSDICTAAGVVTGSCPTTQISVRFFETECFEAAKFVAECCRKDWWPDYSGTNPEFNIGDRGSSLGSITYVSISRNKIDRAKQRNHIVVRGTDNDGVLIKGEAYLSGGSIVEGPPPEPYDKKTKTFTEKKATDVVTLNKIAANYLTEWKKENAGAKVVVDISNGYLAYPGDTITLNKPLLNLVGDFRIHKTTKKIAFVDLEIERPEETEEKLFMETRQYGDLGIYPISSEQMSPVVISSEGLVLLMHFDEGAGNVAKDSSPLLNDGTLVNSPSWTEGKFGQCLDFNSGSSQYVGVPNHPSLQIEENLTLSAWISPDSTRGFFIHKGGTTVGGYLLGRTSGGSIYFYVATTGSGDYVTADDPGSGWHHIVGVCKKKDATTSTLKIYIDGVLKTSEDKTIILDCDHSGEMEIFGDDWYGPAEYYDGKGDEVRIYNRALNAAEVSSLYLYTGLAETPPIPDVDSIHDVDLGPPVGFDATDIDALSEVDPDGTVRAWFRVTIPRVTDAVGYLVAYREDTESNWSFVEVEQKASGDAVVVTPHIRPSPAGSDRTYKFKACTVSKLNQLSSWTSEVSKVAAKDTSAPATPSGLTATSLSNSILLEWAENTEGDLDGYEVYHNTTNDSGTATKIADCRTNYFFWHIEDENDYAVQYFWVKAVDRSGNTSGFSSVASATPGKLAPVDLQIELRPWTSNIKFWFNEGSPDDIYWSAPEDETADPVVEFADGTSVGINADSTTSLALGLHYFYFDESYKTGNKYDIQHSVNYDDAVGEGKGLLAAIQVGKYAMEIRLGCGAEETIVLTYNKLKTEFEGDEDSAVDTGTGDLTTKLGIRVWKYHSDDSMTEITSGSPVAQVDATDTEQTVSATWACPGSTLVSTDRILVAVYNLFVGVGWFELATFITEQLGATKLIKNDWKMNYRQRRVYSGGTTYIYLYWGSETRKTNIEKFKYIGADDTSTILPFNSYAPSIGAGVIVADSILSNHIRSDAVITRHLLAECVTAEKIKALAVETEKLAADAVTAAKIAASSITTEHLNLDLLTSDPSYIAGRLWYRTDVDQLRFAAGTQLTDVSVIPKEPLYEMQSKQENLITNADFEIDRDGDDIPDFWTRSGSGTFVDPKRVTTDSVRGGACVELKANSGSNWCRIMSSFIQVVPGKKYYLGVMVKGEYQNNNDLLVQVRQHKRDKTASTVAYKNYFASEDAWPSGESQAWYLKDDIYEADADVYYVKIYYYCYQPSTTGKVWYDDTIFSEIRAATPTAGIVATTTTEYSSTTECTNSTWEVTTTSLTIPSTAHEKFILNVSVHLMESLAGHSGIHICVRLTKSGETTEYYPSSTWNKVPVVTCPSGRAGEVIFIIPRDRQGWTATVMIYFDYAIGGDYTIKSYMTGYGISPHYHR